MQLHREWPTSHDDLSRRLTLSALLRKRRQKTMRLLQSLVSLILSPRCSGKRLQILRFKASPRICSSSIQQHLMTHFWASKSYALHGRVFAPGTDNFHARSLLTCFMLSSTIYSWSWTVLFGFSPTLWMG